MKNKKLLGYLTGLVCIALCVTMALTACRFVLEDPEDHKPTVGEEKTDPTEGEPTTPEATEPEQTEPDETEPEETEPEETEPEETEPEETQPSGGSTGPNVNTGTGGGYNPGTSDPTEPEDVTEPEIVVPAAGSENNAYVEQFKENSATFTTVLIPAGQKMYYRLKTPGTFLQIEDADASVIYDGTTYQPENGILEIALPADGSQAMNLQFVNKHTDDKAFTVKIRDALGTQDNPIMIDSIADIQTALEQGNADGVFYRWIADQSGVLKMSLGSVECTDGTVDAVITVNGHSVRLSEGNGKAEISVSAEDEVLIQVLTDENAEGNHPQAKIQVCGYVAVIVELKISQVPAQIESVTIAGKQSAIYRITGIKGKALEITEGDFSVVYAGNVYSPDENGVTLVKIPMGTGAAELELINNGSEPKAPMLNVGFATGHKMNPHILTALGELTFNVPSDQDGYYYSYTASSSGVVTFQIWTYPENEEAKTDIIVTNTTTGESVSLWTKDEFGNPVEGYTASVVVKTGDEVSVRVTVTDAIGMYLDADLTIYGELYGSEELPVQVAYPGFTAYVPAGETLYYEGYNLGGMILSMTGSDVTITHNNAVYTPNGGEVSFNVVAEGRNPARFAITNTGSQMAEFEVVFTYPSGHAENPAALVLGTNTLTQTAGASDYYYTFTAPKDGTVTFTFDSNAQWVYAVDNMTQGVYGDTQWSDSDPLLAESTVDVAAGDEIVIRVNTYDTVNMFENPAGTVIFEAKYVSASTQIETVPGTTDAELIPGEYAVYTGVFYGYNLVIEAAENAVVYYQGTAYYADANGQILVEFPKTGTQAELSYTLHNAGSEQMLFSMKLASQNIGTQDNPDTMVPGLNVMTQVENNGADYYYTFKVTAAGKITITLDAKAQWIYQLTNLTQNRTSGAQLSLGGRNTYTLSVKEGDVIELMVNTFDRRTGGSPIGTVEFTIELT